MVAVFLDIGLKTGPIQKKKKLTDTGFCGLSGIWISSIRTVFGYGFD
jgi:hypothetical protein